MTTLNVNIRFRPLAHCNSEAKKDRSATAKGPLEADRLGIAESVKAKPRAVRLGFERADFGQIAALKSGVGD
jgi:hypothetical protein